MAFAGSPCAFVGSLWVLRPAEIAREAGKVQGFNGTESRQTKLSHRVMNQTGPSEEAVQAGSRQTGNKQKFRGRQQVGLPGPRCGEQVCDRRTPRGKISPGKRLEGFVFYER